VDALQHLEITRWSGPFSASLQEQAVHALEHGQVLYCPNLAFELQDEAGRFFSPSCRSGTRKNISYEPARGRLGGASVRDDEARDLAALLARYARVTRGFVDALIPWHSEALTQARTSFRPAEIKLHRPSSYREDDRLLHTDAFPSRPTQGARILRVFTNVNLAGQDRLWRVSGPFEDMARKFLPRVRPPLPGANMILATLRITKGIRSEYDHIMMQLHDRVKADRGYQDEAPQTRLAFPPGSTWLMFSDQVVHAAMVGQYAFEQTFHLPVSAQRWPDTSPLRTLERLTGHPLAPRQL